MHAYPPFFLKQQNNTRAMIMARSRTDRITISAEMQMKYRLVDFVRHNLNNYNCFIFLDCMKLMKVKGIKQEYIEWCFCQQ